MNEVQIELQVEYRTNRLDRRLMEGGISQAEYDQEIRAIDAWAEQEMAKRSH